MLSFQEEDLATIRIKVIGVGGGGGNAVQHMLSAELDGVEFICANTDAQALKNSNVRTTFQLGVGPSHEWRMPRRLPRLDSVQWISGALSQGC